MNIGIALEKFHKKEIREITEQYKRELRSRDEEIERLKQYSRCLYDLLLSFDNLNCDTCTMRAVCNKTNERSKESCISVLVHYRSFSTDLRDDTRLRDSFGLAREMFAENERR